MKKLTVILGKNGRVVATRVGHGPHVDAKSGIRSHIVAGPGQTLHEIEIEVPEQFKSREDLDRFHASVAANIAKGN